MKIKDFSTGDKVFILTENRGRLTGSMIAQATVKTVGRKYVTIDNFSKSRFQECEKDCLQEHVDCGESRLLFATKSDAENYIEKGQLALWLGCISVREAEKYTLEQLRKVKEILEN